MSRQAAPKEVPGNGRWHPSDPVQDPSSGLRRAARIAALTAHAIEDALSRSQTRRHLADHLGVDEGTLRRIEQGLSWPTLWTWVILAEEFGLELPSDSEPLEDVELTGADLRIPEPHPDLASENSDGWFGPSEPSEPSPPGGPRSELPRLQSELRRLNREFARFVKEAVQPEVFKEWEDTYRDIKGTGKCAWIAYGVSETFDADEAITVELPLPASLYRQIVGRGESDPSRTSTDA